ncbi:dienelactone hydrolase family domain-containing [Fusarium acutatum]|uniref:Dienelactone hydrolase family domain-containing n=1 Tax=Fusarium acutatum TaxID=78861 RepID=A0A8H4JVK9_9HYPO|nr:dienelactone hydrolase family domain-containing [Fusarium acutatum]
MNTISHCCELGHAGDDRYQQRGQFKTIGNLEVYETRPLDGDITRILLLLPDGFGLAKHNVILADMFAERGWLVVIPDYFQGDPLPVSLLQRPPGTLLEDVINMKAWLGRHSAQVIHELLVSFFENIHTSLPGIQTSDNASISVVGYCFGGKYALQLSSWVGVRTAAAFHPSFVEESDLSPGDNGSAAPIIVGLAQNDTMVPRTLSADLNQWASSHKRVLNQRTFCNVGHGFAARPNTKNEVERVQFQDAFHYANDFL